MGERGSKLNRFVDKVIGVPLMPFIALYRRLTRVQPTPPRRIAVLAMGAIGDTVLLSALVRAVKQNNSDIRIYLYTTRANASAAGILSDVSGIYPYPLYKIHAMIMHMRSQKYDLLLDSTQWARIGSIVSALSKASLAVGFKTKGQYRSMPYDIIVEHSDQRHEWENFLELGRVIFPGIYAEPHLEKPDIIADMPDNPFIICHMWATGSNARERQWTNKKWALLIDTLAERGFHIILTGSGGDADIYEGFKRLYVADMYKDKVIVGAGKYGLREFAVVAANAEAVVSVNTGSMHIAALLGTPTVGIHGPTSPLRWGPVGAKTVSVSPEGAKSFLNLGYEKTTDDSHSFRVEVDEVLRALEKLDVI